MPLRVIVRDHRVGLLLLDSELEKDTPENLWLDNATSPVLSCPPCKYPMVPD